MPTCPGATDVHRRPPLTYEQTQKYTEDASRFEPVAQDTLKQGAFQEGFKLTTKSHSNLSKGNDIRPFQHQLRRHLIKFDIHF